MDVQGKRLFIFGLGISNLALIEYCQKNQISFNADDDNHDQKNTNLTLRKWQEEDFTNYDFLVVSPGVKFFTQDKHPIISKALANNLAIICDIEFFYLCNPRAKYIAITGTNGKSTTSSLIHHILASKYKKVYLGGNIGVAVFSLKLEADAIYVLELSSFQLDLLDKASFSHAILLNITADHLDRYDSFAHYQRQKYRIFKNNHAIANSCYIYPKLSYFSENKKFLQENNKLNFLSLEQEKQSEYYFLGDDIYHRAEKKMSFSPKDYVLVGHKQNLLTAYAIANDFLISDNQFRQSLKSFRSLEHRLELCSTYKNLQIFNDSKATNAESTKTAFANLDNIFWLAGGVEKEGGIEILKADFPKVKKAFLFGESVESFAKQLNQEVNFAKYNDFYAAITDAFNEGLAAGTQINILLSPAAASFDLFKNFTERGKEFKKIIEILIKNHAAN